MRVDVVLPDSHAPEHDRPTHRALLSLLADLRPAGLCWAGDVGDWQSVSRHANQAQITQLDDDAGAVRAYMREASEAAGYPEEMLLAGNHEMWLEREILARVPALANSLSIPSILRLEERGIRWVPEGAQPVAVGGVRVAHGHQLAAGMSGCLPLYHARRAAEMWGTPAAPIIIGHAHRPQVWHAAAWGGSVWAWALGCLRTLAPPWLRGRPAGWAHQVAIIYTDDRGIPTIYPVNFAAGRCCWGGRIHG